MSLINNLVWNATLTEVAQIYVLLKLYFKTVIVKSELNA
jgi:hypothetical protein